MDFTVTTQNRFESLAERGNGECTISAPKGINRSDFEKSNMENKLVHLFDELRFIRNEQVSCSLGMNVLQQTLGSVNERLNQVALVTNSQTDFLKSLAYKSVDLEARSRRNNLVFRGFIENYAENCFSILRDFLSNRLDIDASRIYIARAHRLGPRNIHRQHNSRPIIANFRDYGDVELIMGKVRLLKGTPFSIDYDYPREIQEARSRIWPKYKELKRESPRSKVQIVYPAKLLQDGHIIHDELPEWAKYTGINKITQVNRISNVGGQRIHNPVLPGQTVNLRAQVNTCDVTSQVIQSNMNLPSSHDQPVIFSADTVGIHSSGNALGIVNDTLLTNNMQPRPQQQDNASVLERTPEVISSATLSAAIATPASKNDGQPPKSVCTEETQVKSVAANSTNPLCDIQDPIEIPARGRSRVSRTVSRSEKRSQSAVPYRRKSVSKQRVSVPVLPGDKNSTTASSSNANNSQGDKNSIGTDTCANNRQDTCAPCENGFFPTSDTLTNTASAASTTATAQ